MEAIAEFRPHMVLLDDDLPDHASPTLLEDLANHTTHPTTVIMLGETPTLDDRVQAFHLGAVDYITLATAPEELALRCEQHLLNGRKLHQLTTLTHKLTNDIEHARTFQHDLLPTPASLTSLAHQHGLDLAMHYQGCDTLAGDYWTVLPLDAHHLAICMVDFTGHGVMAALNTVHLHTLLRGDVDLHHPEAVALLLNHHLGRLLSTGSFATYFYGVLNSHTGHLAYCAGGMPPAIVRHAGGKFTSLLTSGLPLAITPILVTETRHADLRDGDTLLLYSDALTDSPHTNGHRWDMAHMLNLIAQLPATTTPQALISHVLDTFYASVQLPVPDDLTLLALRRAVVCEV
jgi:sigma-B regulation protein RsbU (phosphoserine phosphatase)